MLMTIALKPQRGIGLVELMVGITIGLIVAAAASTVAVNQINEHRQLMLETQVQQDLRTAADLIQHELRRAGFRGTPEHGVWSPASVATALGSGSAQVAIANPYSGVTDNESKTMLSYSYARSRISGGFDASDTVKGNEYFGIKWDSATKVLSLAIGNKADGQPNWEPITDPNTVVITNFRIEVQPQDVNVSDFCDQDCTGPACPKQRVRDVRFQIVGQAKHDPSVVRTLTGVERVRTDALSGVCPS